MLFFTIVLVGVAYAEPVEKIELSGKLIKKLGVGIGIETVLQSTVRQLVEMRIKQDPELKPYEEVMMEYFSKYLSYESIEDDLAKLYVDAFTMEELNEIVAFYASETGKKLIEKSPWILKKSAEIGMSKINENIGELKKMVEEENKRRGK